jgi:exodeoxyribonuclease V alpha subunit
MEFETAMRRLKLFEIPAGENESAKSVREILARLLSLKAVSLGELQTSRDIVKWAIVKSKRNVPEVAYIFLSAMFVSLRDGNTVFNLANKVNESGMLLIDACQRNATGAELTAVEELREKIKTIWPEAIAAADSLDGDIVSKIIRKECAHETFLWAFSKEKDAVSSVSDMIKPRLVVTDEGLSDDELDEVIGYKGEGGVEFTLGEEQKRAVRTTVQHGMTVITGGPGTGKTTIICSILRSLIKKRGLKPADVALIAPTGRAAQRMGEALQAQCAKADAIKDEKTAIASLEGVTIHSLLGGYGPKWNYNQDNPLPHRLVVVDESSMIDLILMRSLLAALRKDCRLVLLGDKNQLPSVNEGAVLGDLIEIGKSEENKAAFVELTESRRFKGKLKECADEFNKGESATVKSSKVSISESERWTELFEMNSTENNCFWYELSSNYPSAKVDAILKDWAQQFGLLKGGALVAAAKAVAMDDKAFNGECSDGTERLFKVLDKSRILSVVRRGPYGVEHINELLLKERFGRIPIEPLVDSGIPVIITRNARSMNLFNGDVGVTVKRPGGGVCVLFPRGKKVVSCPVGLLPSHELAYAMTVHKSQGSEFENVMVVLPNDVKHPLLNRQIIYTGITRAKKRAVIIGSEEALDKALSRKIERDTGLIIGNI